MDNYTEVIDIFNSALDSEVAISLRDEQLEVEFRDKTNIDAQLLNKIKQYKEDIILFLKKDGTLGTDPYNFSELVPIKREENVKLPLSFIQEGIWFIDQYMGSVQYHLPNVKAFGPDLDLSALEFAINEIVNRHEILRTLIKREDGMPFQHILPADSWAMKTTQLDKDFPLEDVQHLIAQEINRPFGLDKDHPIRATLYQIGDLGYVLVLVVHHIAGDAWSMDLISAEMLEIYSAKIAGRMARLEPLQIQYADYAYWQKSQLTDAVLNEQLTYWEKKLSGVEGIDLPLDFPRPQLQSIKGQSLEFDLGGELSQRLYAVCKTEGVTLFMLLLTAFKVLLHRYSGQSDVCVGSPVTNRNYKELEGLVGLFINTIALRTNWQGNPTFKELLSLVKEETITSFQYQDTPFDQVVSRVVKKREPSRNPIFQVMFSLETKGQVNGEVKGANAYIPKVAEAPLQALMADLEDQYRQSKMDLMMTVEEYAGGIKFKLGYCTDLFREASIAQMGRHFEQLLHLIVHDIDQPISTLPLLSAQEQKQLLVDFNQTTADYPSDETIISLFRQQCHKNPQHTAIVMGEQKMSYEELEGRSNQVAHFLLQSVGVKSGDLVGIMLEREFDLIPVIFGILKAGAAYVPIDPSYPPARVAAITEDAELRVLITRSVFAALAPENCELLDLDKAYSKIVAQSTAAPDLVLNANDLAYVIFTSGSTGRPKGVMIAHHSMVNRILWMQQHYPLTQQDVLLQKTPLVFDVSVWELFWWPISGASLCLLPPEGEKDPAIIVEAIDQHKVSTLHFVPSMLDSFLLYATEMPSKRPLASLRQVFSSGEALQPEQVSSFGEMLYDFNRCKLTNLYGPTEATVDVAYFDCDFNESYLSVPIGRPIQNTKLYILSKEGQTVPLGVAGELCIAGVGLAKGYIGQPQLTREKFVAHPHINNERIYKTGDLARWLPDGNIEYLGRMDDQVKVRGIRVELGEISAAIGQYPAISQSTVLVKDDTRAGKQLVTFLVPREDYDKADLMRHLARILPKYMIPSLVVELDQLPLTTNGKLDRKALLLSIDETHWSSEFEPPSSETEKRLATIWKELLHLRQVGVNDDFFEIGGHSLLATRALVEIQRRFEIKLQVKDLFMAPTIRQLAGILDARSTEQPVLSIEPQERSVYVPLSFSQEFIWFIDQFSGSQHYHIPLVQGFDAELDAEALAFAMNALINRHESLRTVIREEGGTPYQFVLPKDSWTLDNEIIATDTSTQQLELLVKNQLEQPFDLKTDHPIRANLYQIGAQGYLLVVVLHHIACDAWSLDLLQKEVLDLYAARKANRTIDLPSLPFQYADYAIWQRNALNKEKLEEKLMYWKEELRGVARLDLPKDFPAEGKRSIRGRILEMQIEQPLAQQLKILCKQEGVTLYMLLLTAFKVLLHRYTGQTNICVSSPVANRGFKDLGGLIGLFINTTVLRSDLNGNPSFRDLLSIIKAKTVERFAYQDVPIDLVVNRVLGKRTLEANPLLQVAFSVQNEQPTSSVLPADLAILPAEKTAMELQLAGFSPSYDFAKADLNMIVAEQGELLQIYLEYSTDLFREERMQRLVTHFKTLLTSIVHDITQPIGRLNLLEEKEIQQLRSEFNEIVTVPQSPKTIGEILAAQAAQRPNAVAVVDDFLSLNYAFLEEKSNQVAHYLLSCGVEQEERIGVLLEKSAETVVAILGIIKAGAAYVPLDPELPPARLAFMVKDASMTKALTSIQLRSKLDGLVEKCVCLREIWEDISTMPGDAPTDRQKPDSLMYVLYTSGSTGHPKGVMVEQQGVVNMSMSQIERFGIRADDRVMQFAATTFDASVSEIFMALFSGATLVLPRQAIVKDVSKFASYIKDQSITVVTLPPAYLHNLKPGQLASIRVLITAGEAADPNDALAFSKELQLYNAYGPTEYSVCISTFKVESDSALVSSVPIGRPIANTEVFILDAEDGLCPIGVWGELCVSGLGLARGYQNLPELTARHFSEHPFEAGKRMYQTGDVARWRSDGNLEFLGRNDNQVKIRGFRVELDEVNAKIQGLKGVIQAATMVQGRAALERKIRTFIHTEEQLSSEQIKSDLKQQLPEYMIPAEFICVPEIPVTRHGKVDFSALQEMERRLAKVENEQKPSAVKHVDKELVRIWKEILKTEDISIDENFFDVGGHSLLATRVVASVRDQLNIEMQVEDLFNAPTIVELGKLLQGRSRNRAMAPIVAAEERPAIIPLSTSQEFLWVIDRYTGSSHYHLPLIQGFGPDLKVEALEYALKTLINRHESLRTIVKEENGTPFQVILPPDQWAMNYVEWDEIEADWELEGAIAEQLNRPFYLDREHPIRATLYKIGNKGFIMCVVLHHITADAWSMNILARELLEFYSAKLTDRLPNLNPLPIQYVDYALWQQQIFKGEILEAKLQYWEEQLLGVSPLNLPLDFPRPNMQSIRGDRVSFKFNKRLSADLKQLCREQEVTLFMLLLGAFKITLFKYSGQSDICVGTPVANRGHQALEGLIGFFINTIALRSKMDGSQAFVDFLAALKKRTIEGFNHQDTPIDRVVDRVIGQRDLSKNPLFQVLFSMQNAMQELDLTTDNIALVKHRKAISGFSASGLDSNYKYAQMDMVLNAMEEGDRLSFHLTYCTDLFKEETVRGFVKHFRQILESIVKNINQPIGEIQMLSRSERQKLLKRFNQTKQPFDAPTSVLGLFDESLRKTPNAIALVTDSEEITYEELDLRSNRLAQYLIQEKGVLPEAFVGLQLERSHWSIISLLAIIKTGATYVPIDIGCPEDRVNFIVKDIPCSSVLDADTLMDFHRKEAQFNYQRPKLRWKASQNVYVIYTSGSTGRPKGVPITHHNLLNYLLWAQAAYLGDRPHFNFPFFTPLSFDLTQTSVWLSLISGGRLHIVNKKDVAEDIKYVLSNEDINTVKLTPAHVHLMEDIFHTDVECFILGGEELQWSQVMHLRSMNPDCRIFNEYGPTEATIGCSLFEVKDGDNGSIPIGKPIANTQLYILGANSQPVPIGVIGELCIGGQGVSEGYLNRPALNATKFVKDPFDKRRKTKLYKTGDLAKWMPDGNIAFLGRKDDQVKVRGYRIELGEITSLLDGFAYISQNVVLVKEDKLGNKLLAAFVVPKEGFDKEALKSYLAAKLPSYMIPSLIVVMSELPLTENSKINKLALLKRDVKTLVENPNALPRNAVERKLLEMWEEMFDVTQLGVYDNFFDVGGHSLLAIRHIAAINKAFTSNLDITTLFDHPTIEGLAKIIESGISESYPALVKVSKNSHNPPYIFCASSDWGQSPSYQELAEMLDDNITLYCFESPGLDGLTPVIDSIEERVDYYIEEMQKIDPVGPYYLGGYSFGAKVAYELAYQLTKRGFEVGQLFIFDSFAPHLMPIHPYSFEERLLQWTNIYYNVGKKEKIPTTLTVEDFEGKTREEQFQLVFEMLNAGGRDVPFLNVKGFASVWISNVSSEYMPEVDDPIEVPVTLYAYNPEIDYGWSGLCKGEIRVVRSYGNHSFVIKKSHAANVVLDMIEFFKQ